MVLEHAGLLRREIKGRNHYCWIEPRPLREADEWIVRLILISSLLRAKPQITSVAEKAGVHSLIERTVLAFIDLAEADVHRGLSWELARDAERISGGKGFSTAIASVPGLSSQKLV